MVKERAQTDATARLQYRALVHREADGYGRGSGFKTELRRPCNNEGVELYGLLFSIEHVEGKIMVLLVAAKAFRTLSSSFVGPVYVLLLCCLRWILRLLFCAVCLKLMAP